MIHVGAMIVHKLNMAVMAECFVMTTMASDDEAAVAEGDEAAIEVVCERDRW
jgi:hypothetical protein